MSVVIMVVFGLLMLFVMEAMVWGKRAKLWAVSRSGFLFLFSNLSDLYETMPNNNKKKYRLLIARLSYFSLGILLVDPHCGVVKEFPGVAGKIAGMYCAGGVVYLMRVS